MAASSKDKTNDSQETYIRNLLMRVKTEANDEEWKVPEMVGFYSEQTLPIAPVHPTSESLLNSVKKVVCSPDFPVKNYPDNKVQISVVAQPQSNFQCQVCQKMFSTKATYMAHQKTHVKEEDPYRCNICSKSFAVPARLTRHYRTHTGEKPFRCEFCNKSFSVKENLSVHRRIHTKERPYKCEVCSRAFEHSGKLHRHMRIHTGERPHKCTVCAKTFIQSGQLVIHMRTHTGEKPYVCQVCQKGFTCSKQLKVHSRTHTGEKPYSCEICGKSFGYNHVLKLHQVAHYGEKVYKCTICNDTFNSKKSMEAHIKSHSDNVTPPPALTPPASSNSSESSCSSTSDKENTTLKELVTIHHQESPPPTSYDTDILYYRYGRNSPTYNPHNYSAGVELLAAAATASERIDFNSHSDVVFNLMTKTHVPQEVVAALRHPAYFTTPSVQYPVIDTDHEIRRRVEEALGVDMSLDLPSESEQIITPPVSPVPLPRHCSPEPEIRDPELSLPPRKRSKMILKSMEASIDLSPVRYSSVIHYARAS